jgi:hypothetical protein
MSLLVGLAAGLVAEESEAAGIAHRSLCSPRLVKFKEGGASFRWKDYAMGGKQKVMTSPRRSSHPRASVRVP